MILAGREPGIRLKRPTRAMECINSSAVSARRSSNGTAAPIMYSVQCRIEPSGSSNGTFLMANGFSSSGPSTSFIDGGPMPHRLVQLRLCKSIRPQRTEPLPPPPYCPICLPACGNRLLLCCAACLIRPLHFFLAFYLKKANRSTLQCRQIERRTRGLAGLCTSA
jgi:hypothetical protein